MQHQKIKIKGLNMKTLRSNDCAGTEWFARADRMFDDPESGLWYFRTREGKDIGPFRYRSEAQEMLTRFIAGIEAAAQKAATVDKLRFRPRVVSRASDAYFPAPQ
jgi:hypothetical protein